MTSLATQLTTLPQSKQQAFVNSLSNQDAYVLLMALEAEECRASLKTFMRAVWPIIEPTPFIDGLPIDAMVVHLEALTRGDIKRLVINIPPRHTKSTLLVIWRVWVWLQNPSERILSASYSLNLSIRDNLRCRRIIEDPWFQTRFGNDFKLTGDQNAKSHFDNDKNGYQMSLSIAGGTTGHGGSILVCLWYNVEVTTDRGRLRIGDIVENRLPVRVLAFDHQANTFRWQCVEEYESSSGRDSVRVTFSDDRTVDATDDHPFYVVGRGYVPAAQLNGGDEVVTDEGFLYHLQQGSGPQAIPSCSGETPVLQQCLSHNVAEGWHFLSDQGYLRDVWERMRSQTSRDECCAPLLQQDMLRHVAEGNGATSQSRVRDVRERSHAQTVRIGESRACVLQPGLPLCTDKQDYHASRSGAYGNLYLRNVWSSVRAISQLCISRQTSFLQPCMSWGMGEGRKQSRLSRRESCSPVPLLREDVLSQARLCISWQCQVLLTLLQRQSKSGKSATQPIRLLRLLWRKNQTQDSCSGRQAKLLLSQMRQSITQRIHQWREQWALHRWYGNAPLSERLFRVSPSYSRARREPVQAVSYDQGETWQRTACTSHQLRYPSQRPYKSRFSLPMVPRENAWDARTAVRMESVLVRCVEPIPVPQKVYNLRVAEDHNYFANGVLVHNCDDIHNADEAHSEKDRETALNWFREVWTNRLNDQLNDRMLLVGQRIHAADVCGYVLSERPDWISLILSAFYESARHCTTPIWSDPRKEEGALLWPQRFSEEVLDGLRRDLGAMGFAAQYQQHPTPAGGGQFKSRWFRYFTSEDECYILETPEETTRHRKSTCWHFATVDLAISLKQTADYTVIATWAVTPDRDLLLVDCLHDHLDNPEQQKQISLAFQKHHPDYFKVENVAYQLALIQQLRRQGLPVREYKPIKDKVSRASSASVFYEGGKVYHPKSAHWLAEWEEELLLFPNAAHDDRVDVTSMACDEISGPLASASDHVEAMKRRVALAQSRSAQTAPAGGVTGWQR